jgi:hypothetical protein
MSNTSHSPLSTMTVADFIAWPGGGTGWRFQLVDGEVRAIDTHLGDEPTT